MIKNILFYLFVLAAAFTFSVVYYAWFSWFLLIAVICIPIASLIISLPFMVVSVVRGLDCFCDETVYNYRPFRIGVCAKNGKAVFCPFLKIKFKAVNRFASKRKAVVMKYGGKIGSSITAECDFLSQHCGCIEISAKYGRVYDFTGIFFLPIRLNFSAKSAVMPIPEKPETMPDSQSAVILGYKPIANGFSDDYELRQYQPGDSLKSIHWKLSSKSDELIVRQPCEPVRKKLIINPRICDKPDTNDFILARFSYVCSFLIESETPFYALDSRSGEVTKINSENDVRRFLISLYCGYSATNRESLENSTFYNILPDGEEVSEQ